MIKTYSFPEKYQEKIAAALRDIGSHLENSSQLAKAVIKLSDHYQKNEKITPWTDPELMSAYLAYFLPLNYIRNVKVFDELSQMQPLLTFKDYVDFGFGLGASLLAAQDTGVVHQDHTYYALDISQKPIDLFEKYFSPPPLRRQYQPTGARSSLGVFSYSLNEISTVPSWFYKLDTIVILEPSTSIWGRKLMQWRSALKENGYSLWAPCTHQLDCPLLTHSKKDWCHDRVHWTQPDWFKSLESHLPMKNNTLTHSYLIASRTPPPQTSSVGRVVGDELKEKGKSRWLYCRNDQREFLSWLNKQGPSPGWHRGEKISPQVDEVKGNEIRIKLY